MTLPIVVAFPVYNRADLLKRALEGWSKVRGIEDAEMVFCVEPGCAESLALCNAVDFTTRHVWRNSERLGHARNVAKSMAIAFGSQHLRAGYAIQALDDYVPATDLLELHAWHRDRYADDDTVLGLCSSRDVPAPFGGLAGVWRCQLIGGMTGFHMRKWRMLATQWQAKATDNGWWSWVNAEWLQSGPQLDVLFPALSRAEDIGDPHPVSCFMPDPPPTAYTEVRSMRERATGFTRWYEETPVG